MFKIILNLIYTKASKEQWQLRIGSYLIRKGTRHKVGDIVHRTDHVGKVKVMYIKNLFFNFSQNKVTYTLDRKRIQ